MTAGEVMQHSVDGLIAELHGSSVPSAAETAPTDIEPRYQHAFLSTVIAEQPDRRLALIVLVLSAVGFAVAIPFAKLPLLQVNAFIPAYESALLLIDAITALMLFGQFRWSRSPALLVLAAGYLYDALLIIPHAMSFPGAFAPTGLLGASPHTTAWLFNFWHGVSALRHRIRRPKRTRNARWTSAKGLHRLSNRLGDDRCHRRACQWVDGASRPRRQPAAGVDERQRL
jgi:hypothetical protein